MRIRRSVILIIVALVVLVGGGLLYLQTRMAAEQFRRVAEQTLTRRLNLPVQIGSMSLSLLHGSLEFHRITIGNLSAAAPEQAGQHIDAPFLTVNWARVAFRPTSLLRGVPQIRSLVIHGPRLQITDSPASSSTFAKLVSSLSEISADGETEGFPVLLEQGVIAYRSTIPLHNLQVDGLSGRLDWPSRTQAVVAVATDNIMVRLGTYKLQKIRLQARARLTRDDLQVEQLSLAKDGSLLTVTGIVRAGAGRPQVELNVAGQIDPIALASRLGGTAPWKKYLTVKGKIVAETTPRTFNANFLLEDDSGRLVGQTDTMIQNALLTVKRLSLHHSASRLTADGTLDLKAMTADLNLSLHGVLEDVVQLFQTDAPVAGPIVAQVRLTGLASNLNGAGHLEMRQLRVGSEQIDALEAQLAIQGTELTLPSLSGRYHGIPFTASATVEAGGAYRFALLPTKIDVASIRRLADYGGRGTIVVSLAGSGQGLEPHIDGELALHDLALREVRFGRGQIRFTLEDGRWHWTLAGSRTLQATGVAPLLLAGPLQIDASATNLDLTPLFQTLRAQMRVPITARADGRLRAVGTLPELSDLTGRIELDDLRGTAGSTPLGLRQPTRIVLEPEILRVDSLGLTGPGLSLTLTGGIRPGGRLDLSLSGYAPFDVIKPWVPAVRDLQGTPKLQLSLIGELKAVQVNGRAELTQIRVQPKIIPIWIFAEAGEVTFNNDRVRYTIAEGSLAEGGLKGEGTARRAGGSWNHTLEFDVDRAQLDSINDQLLPERRWVTGELSTRVALAFDTAPHRATVPSLQGQLTMRLKGGSLSHYPALIRLFGLLGAPAQPYRLPDLTRERMPYRKITADIAVKDGVMHTNNLLLDSQVMRLTGVGQLRVADQHVALDLAVRPLQVLEHGIRKIPLLGRILPKTQSLAVTRFDMEGPWDDPTISVAPVKSLSHTLRDLLLLPLLAPWRLVAPDR